MDIAEVCFPTSESLSAEGPDPAQDLFISLNFTPLYTNNPTYTGLGVVRQIR